MFCKQNRSRSSGSLESCLVKVHYVCLRRYDISDHIQVDMKQVELVPYARAAALNIFCKQSGSRSSGSRESCLVMVHYVAYGDMKCLIIHKWNLYARVAALNFFVNTMDLDQAAPMRTA